MANTPNTPNTVFSPSSLLVPNPDDSKTPDQINIDNGGFQMGYPYVSEEPTSEAFIPPSGKGGTGYYLIKTLVNIWGVHPIFMNPFKAMAKEYNARTGKSIGIGSAFRTRAEQQKLYDEGIKKHGIKEVGKWVAPPGRSMHEYGFAMDISSITANELERTGLLAKHGFIRNLMPSATRTKGEPWHIELKAYLGRYDEIRSGKIPAENFHPNFVEYPEISKGSSISTVAVKEIIPAIPDIPVIPSSGTVPTDRELMNELPCGPVMKRSLPYLGYTNEREIRPAYTKRVPGAKKFILDMVDIEGNSYAISLGDCSVVSAIALTPSPESLTINSAKIITRYHTMTRWVEEHWGDEIDTITFTGGTYGLFEYYNDQKYKGEGLTEVNRRKTDPYKMLKEVARIVKSNGMLYHDRHTYAPESDSFLKDPSNVHFVGNHPRKGLPKERLYIKLFYDYITCLGYIESFDIIEDNAPYRLKYSLTYKAEKTVYNQGKTADRVPGQTYFDIESPFTAVPNTEPKEMQLPTDLNSNIVVGTAKIPDSFIYAGVSNSDKNPVFSGPGSPLDGGNA